MQQQLKLHAKLPKQEKSQLTSTSHWFQKLFRQQYMLIVKHNSWDQAQPSTHLLNQIDSYATKGGHISEWDTAEIDKLQQGAKQQTLQRVPR